MLNPLSFSKILNRSVTAAMTFGVLVSSSLAALAAGPLDMIPSDATVVVRLKSPSGTISKIGTFANQVQPGIGFLIQAQAQSLGIGISNPTLGCVDLNRDWHIAVFASPNAQPVVAYVIPASDVDAMKTALGDGFTTTVNENWVAYSDDEAIIELVEDCLAGDEDSLGKSLDRVVQAKFDNSDVSIYVNLESLVATYQNRINDAEDQVPGFIDIIMTQLEQGQQAQSFDLDTMRTLYEDISKTAFQAVRDSDAFVFGLGFDNTTLTIDETLLVKEDTESAKYIAKNKTSGLKILNRLPTGQHGYIGLKGDMKGFTKWGMSMNSQMIKDEELKKKFEKSFESFNDVELGEMGFAFSIRERTSSIMEGVALMQANPASKIRDMMRSMGSYTMEMPGMKQEVTLKQDAETYGDLKADVLTIRQEPTQPEGVDPAVGEEIQKMQKRMQELLLGADGMTQRVVIKDGHIVQGFNGDQELMKAAIAAFDAPTTETTSVMQTSRARLMENANVVALVDLASIMLTGVKIADSIEEVPLNLPADQLRMLKVAPSYVGFGLGTGPRSVEVRTEVPAATIKGIMQIVQLIQAAQRGGAGGARGF